MKCSNTLLATSLVLLICVNVSKNVLGLWSLLVYLLIIALVVYILHQITARKTPSSLKFISNLRDLLEGNRQNDPPLSYKILERTKQPFQERQICLECTQNGCNKHCVQVQLEPKPWSLLRVDRRVNDELELLLNGLIEKHTKDWLALVTIDHASQTEILNQIKHLVRHVLGTLVLRFHDSFQLNPFLLSHLPKLVFQHYEMYVYGKRHARSACFIEESVLRQYGPLLHPALKSSHAEYRYLKMIANLVVQTSLPPRLLNYDLVGVFLQELVAGPLLGTLVELVSDGDNINKLLIALLQEDFECESISQGLLFELNCLTIYFSFHL